MKKVLIGAVVFGMMSSGAAFAGQAHDNTGCGLGTLLFKDNANDSIVLQALQATTNGTFGNQTFGITSGTSDCKQPSKFVNNERLKEFVVANIDSLAKDIAKGQGESLDTVAELMNIPSEKRAMVYAQLQVNFSNIFTSERVEAADVIDNIASVVNS